MTSKLNNKTECNRDSSTMQESIQKMTEYMTIVKNIQHSFQAVIFFHVEVGEMDE
jgi:hypothetical protein